MKYKSNKNKNVIKINSYRKKWELNIGIVMFGMIFFYLLVVLFNHITDEHINVYEVQKGSIINDTVYTGLIQRHEKVVKAEESGYIQYYYPEISRVSMGQNIYTLSANIIDMEQYNSNINQVLTDLEISDIKTKIQQFNSSYHENNFSEVYRLKGDLDTIINSNDTKEKINILNDLSLKKNQKIYTSKMSGILLYEFDGYEGFEEGDITQAFFDRNAYSSSYINADEPVNSGDSVYKVVVDELWSIYINLDNSDINTLKNVNSVNVKCMKDDAILPAQFSIIQINGYNYGRLDFNEGMVRYATDRFLEIELILQDLEGYKIPISSVVQNSYYIIPVSYVTKGGENSNMGILTKVDSNNVKFVDLSFYYKDDSYYYVSVNDLALNTVIIEEETNDTYMIAESRNLYGVYTVNRGYAILRYINIINSSDEYHIVEELSSYSIQNYDYIGLYGYKINEGDLVY